MEKLTRRQFIVRGGSAAFGVAAGFTHLSAETKAGTKSRVVVARCDAALDSTGGVSAPDVEKLLDAALMRFSGQSTPTAAWLKYVKPSDTVGVKANVMMNATCPEVLRAIVKRLLSIGVKDENIITWDRNAAGIGIKGVQTRDQQFGYDPKTHISTIVTEKCTALINVPGLKAHWITGIAVALKNWVGVVQGLNPSDKNVTYAIHADNGAECCKFNAMPVIRDKCRLVIVDALRPLCHAGPQVNPRYLWPHKALIVSTDPVAVDTVCHQILRKQRDKMSLGPIQPPARHLPLADSKYKLGNSDPRNIDSIEMEI